MISGRRGAIFGNMEIEMRAILGGCYGGWLGWRKMTTGRRTGWKCMLRLAMAIHKHDMFLLCQISADGDTRKQTSSVNCGPEDIQMRCGVVLAAGVDVGQFGPCGWR